MSFQRIVNIICNNLWQDAERDLRADWLNKKEDAISSEVNERVRNIESQRRRVYDGYGRSYYTYNTVSYIERNDIREQVRNEYKRNFDRNVLPDLENKWKQKIEAADFVERLEQFFQRHTWLSSLADSIDSSSLPFQYIEPIIRETLVSSVSRYGRQFKLTTNGHYGATRFDIQWPDFNWDKYQNRFHDFPIRTIYKKKWGLYDSLPNLSRRWTNLRDPSHYQLTRMDVYRLLANHFSFFDIYRHPSVKLDGHYATKVMPVELNELDKLDDKTRERCDIWLINIGDVNNPEWILCDTRNHKLYVSPQIARDVDFELKLNTIRRTLTVEQVVDVTNECGTQYTDIPDRLIWQYQLFGRVLPYCLQADQSQPLADYRNQISLYHLIAYVWESLTDSHELKSNGADKTAKRFQYAHPLSDQPWHRLLASGAYDNKSGIDELTALRGSKILSAVDGNYIQIKPNPDSKDHYNLTTTVEGDSFLQACFMACFEPVSQIDLTLTPKSKKDMPDVPLYIFDKAIERLNYVRFTIKGDEKSIKPGHFPPLVRISNGAACNRLLQTAYAMPLAELSIKDRWDDAGRLILSMFKQHAEELSPTAIQTYLEKEKEWRKNWFHPNNAPESDSFDWQLAQFAQMGRLGLDAFFDHLRKTHLEPWHPIHQTPALNIPVLFDLNGDHLLSAAQYIEYLAEQMSSFMEDERCIPKFSQIHLILPDQSTRAAREETAKLIHSVSDCKYKHSEETDAFYLYEFKRLSDEAQDNWLTELERLANLGDKPLITMIRIPELDSQVSSDSKKNQLKSRYRSLQNKILDNQRLHHQNQLADNTNIFYQGANGTLDPMVDIRNLKHRLKQPFDGKDETILLAANTPGIQQELQQNVEARHEIVQQIEEKRVVYEEKEPEIKRYNLDLSRLITRRNVQTRLESIDESKDWVRSFNHWVGSQVDATNLINYIEPEAIEVIQQNSQYFRMGMALNHLPFGFFLAHHPSHRNSYILCYDDKRAKQERYEWEAKTKELRNPFHPHLDSKAKPVDFDGDFRQFNSKGNNEDSQVAFWYYLATQSVSQTHKQQQTECLRKVAKRHFNAMWPDIPTLMSRFEVSGTIERPCNLTTVKEYIAGWAQPILGYGKAHDFILAFIGSMDEAQLKTFGQLCYFYDSQKDKQGSRHFIRVAHTIYRTFGADNFAIWQKAIFAKSDNATELLDKPTLDAMGLSLITLKDKSPAYTSIWFKLLADQSKRNGMVRYDRLWYAYQTLIAYIDSRQLTIDEAVINRLLSDNDNFQAIIWLDRLYHCLKHIDGQLYEKNAQQAILDNLDSIDWQSNGLSYAMAHNQMPYWSKDLALHQFAHASPENGYEPVWDKPIAKKDLMVQFGRYLAAKLNINYKQYQHYAEQISPILESEHMSYPVARLLLTHLAHGVDNVVDWTTSETESVIKTLSHESLKDAVAWVNHQFKLDIGSRSDRYQVTLAHLPLICQVLDRFGLDFLAVCSEQQRFDLLNALGKTCQFMESQSLLESTNIVLRLANMVSLAIKHDSYLKAMQQTPWLLSPKNGIWKGWGFSDNKVKSTCQKRLLQQLESITYAKSSWLPSKEDIENALRQIAESKTSTDELEDKRRQLIANWVSQGCAIGEQDATFRDLTPKEQDNLTLQFTEQLLPQHARENASLFHMLVPHLAIEANLMNPEEIFTKFVAQLKRIDNKPHFNDLGIVLGSIVHHIQTQLPTKMSMQQLTDLLDSLMLAEHDELTHFPNDMFAELLSQTGKNLTNHRLNDLTANLEPSLKHNLKLIINSQIPKQVKPTLFRLIPKGIGDDKFLWIVNMFAVYQVNGIDLSYQLALANALLLTNSAAIHDRDQLTDALLYLPDNIDDQQLFLKSRHQLIKAVNKSGSVSQLKMMMPLLLSKEQPSPEIEIIGIRTLSAHAKNAEALKQVLKTLSHEALVQLAEYCSHPPTPTAEYLIKHLPKYEVSKLIHHFETVDQAKGLRHYSVTKSDKTELKRILGGIKEKNTGFVSDAKQKQVMGLLYYVNAFAQENDLANIPSENLKASIRQTAQWLQATNDETAQITYRLQLLSMLREVLLRQTGKWANHTQMIDLIYASLHNDESLFHQVKTGQGKSIITIMRVAFHALNGKVVDVFTAKESLSSRDHEEFGHILDAIGIEHNHILPNSDENAYKVGDDVFGAVNYMTPGSFSLFQSGHCWTEGSKRYINYSSKERVAFFDEGDHVLLDEQTMFNFSYSGDSGNLYNYDTWVYQATWRYFQSIKDTLPTNEKGIPFISRKQHLAGLCEYLQEQGDFAPVQSSFIRTYLAPIVEENVKDKQAAIIERDKVLSNLLSAAYTANNLEENRDYCVQTGTITLNDGVTLDGRIAKVVINNQVQGGATYSERVHQFLHVRLNEQALGRGEQPNFFIAPDSDIVLSQNVPALIQHYYGQIEGCSGTMGDAGDLAVYRERFGINHVVKLPTHEVSQTTYLGMIFCDGQKAHEDEITRCLTHFKDQPTLLVSEDDVAVKSLSNRLRKLLPETMAKKLICDTNDSGRAEKDILPHAGTPGVIVNSSRMARGTDIKPETEQGLLVIRSNPDIPRFAKQSGGRQGRNGAKGILIDIIDYAKVRQTYTAFAKSEQYAGRLMELMEREKHHLEKKVLKHHDKGSTKWDWIVGSEDKQEKYIKTRVVQFLKREIKIQREQNIRSKEAIVSECSSHVIAQLMHHIGDDQTMMRNIRKDWLRCRETIESAWQQRMNGAVEENDIVLMAFYEKARTAWQTFASQYPDHLKTDLLDDPDAILKSARSMRKLAWHTGDDRVPVSEPTQQADMTEVIHFYQDWLERVGPRVLSDLPTSLQQRFYGAAKHGLNDLDAFYQALVGASQSKPDVDQKILVSNTQSLFTQLANLPLPQVSYLPLAYMTSIVQTFDEAKIKPNFEDKLSCLAQLFEQSYAQPVSDLTEHHMVTLGETSQFLMRLACRGFVDKDGDDYRRFTTYQTLANIADVLWLQYWPTLTPNQFACFDRFINQDESVARLLTTRLPKNHWQKLLGQLSRYDLNQPEDVIYLDSVMRYFRDNQELLNHSHPETITSLLDIFFYYPHRRVDATLFPKPDCLTHATVEDNVRFIHFIAEQYMINEKEIQQLVEIINDAYAEDKVGAEAMQQTVMPEITFLPTNIPFDIIRTRIEGIADQQSLRGFKQIITTLTELGVALNRFTNRKGITKPENGLPIEHELENLLKRTQAIITLKDGENRLYEATTILTQLSQAKFDSFDANTCLMAVEQYGDDYECLLDVLSRAKQVMVADVYARFQQTCFAEEDKPQLSKLSNVVSLFETYHDVFSENLGDHQIQQSAVLNQCLKRQGVESVIAKFKLVSKHDANLSNSHVWLQWQAPSFDQQVFERHIQFIKESDTLPAKLKTRILTALDDGYSLSRLETFVRLAHQDRQTGDAIPQEQLLYIFDKWYEEAIKHGNHLKTVFEAQKIANVLETESSDNAKIRLAQHIPTYDGLFGTFNHENQGSMRIGLMHSIAHSLISFSQAVQEKCWSFYQTLIGKVGDVKQQMDQLPEHQRSSGLRDILTNLKGLTMELAFVAKPEHSLDMVGDKVNYYNRLVEAFEGQYTGSWLKYFTINATRWQQAQSLFTELKDITNPTHEPRPLANFYQSMLDVIEQTQMDIIEQDKANHIGNKKGYSRLFDITQQLGLQVCKDIIANKSLDNTTKEKAKQYLQHQEQYVVHQLWDRLPSNHPLVADIQPYARNTEASDPAAIHRCKTAIAKVQAADLPKEVRYLLPMLKGHFEITAEMEHQARSELGLA